MWEVLREMAVPLELRRGLHLLYQGSSVRLLVGGELAERSIPVRSGIKQRCPSSGSLWALLYDPVVRLLASSSRLEEMTVGCFADDVAAAARRVRRALPSLMRAFLVVRRATMLAANVRKTKLVYFGQARVDDVATALSAHTSGEAMCVTRVGVYLGVPIGLDADGCFWDSVVTKVRRATHHISGLGLTMSDRIRAYRMSGQSTASYLMQFRCPDGALVRADRAALAMCMSAPMHAMGPGLLPHLPVFGGALRLPEVATLGQAASIRCALRHDRVGMHLDRLRRVAEDERSLIVPRHRAWQQANALAHLSRAMDAANSLPARVREATEVQREVQAHLERSKAAEDVLGWLRRRMGALHGEDIPDGPLRRCTVRLRARFQALPPFVAVATLRIVGNAWLTSRRMSRRPATCCVVFAAVGGDCLRHYIGCPRLASAIRASRAHPPCWVHSGSMRLATFLAPAPPAEVLRVGVWNYVAHLAYSSARRYARPATEDEVQGLVRTAIRSTFVRAPGARAIFMGA